MTLSRLLSLAGGIFLLTGVFVFASVAQTPTPVGAALLDCKRVAGLIQPFPRTPLSANAIDCYRLTVARDRYLRLLVQQEGGDITAQVFDEVGKPRTRLLHHPDPDDRSEVISLMTGSSAQE